MITDDGTDRTETGQEVAYTPPALTPEQTHLLGHLQRREVSRAVNQVLADHGLPLEVSRIEFQPTSTPAPAPSGATEGDGPPTKMPPPGGAYMCWQETVGGPWICICLPPTTMSS